MSGRGRSRIELFLRLLSPFCFPQISNPTNLIESRSQAMIVFQILFCFHNSGLLFYIITWADFSKWICILSVFSCTPVPGHTSCLTHFFLVRIQLNCYSSALPHKISLESLDTWAPKKEVRPHITEGQGSSIAHGYLQTGSDSVSQYPVSWFSTTSSFFSPLLCLNHIDTRCLQLPWKPVTQSQERQTDYAFSTWPWLILDHV